LKNLGISVLGPVVFLYPLGAKLSGNLAGDMAFVFLFLSLRCGGTVLAARGPLDLVGADPPP
jgi:hypothetical protein